MFISFTNFLEKRPQRVYNQLPSFRLIFFYPYQFSDIFNLSRKIFLINEACQPINKCPEELCKATYIPCCF